MTGPERGARPPALRAEPKPPLDPEAGRRRGGRHWLILIVGWAFVLLGFAGLVLPFLQGILFLFVGLWLLSHELEAARRLRDRAIRHLPARWRPALDRAEAWSDRWLDRLRGR